MEDTVIQRRKVEAQDRITEVIRVDVASFRGDYKDSCN